MASNGVTQNAWARRVISDPAVTKTELLVALVASSRANFRTGVLATTHGDLGAACGLASDTVQTHITKLTERGYLKRDQKGYSVPGLRPVPSVYVLTVPTEVALQPGTETGTDTATEPGTAPTDVAPRPGPVGGAGPGTRQALQPVSIHNGSAAPPVAGAPEAAPQTAMSDADLLKSLGEQTKPYADLLKEALAADRPRLREVYLLRCRVRSTKTVAELESLRAAIAALADEGTRDWANDQLTKLRPAASKRTVTSDVV